MSRYPDVKINKQFRNPELEVILQRHLEFERKGDNQRLAFPRTFPLI